MFFSGATEPQEQHPLSLFMSYLSCPTISFVLYKVAFWECQDQTHIFLVFSTQSGVKQHEGLVRLQEAQSAQTGKGEEEGKVNEQREGVMGPGDQGGRRRRSKKKKKKMEGAHGSGEVGNFYKTLFNQPLSNSASRCSAPLFVS